VTAAALVMVRVPLSVERDAWVEDDGGPGSERQRGSGSDGEVTGEEVSLIRRGADRREGQGAGSEAAAEEVDILEALIIGQQRHIGGGDRTGGVEDIVVRSPA